MSQNLDSDQINRLWEHGMHEDNGFNDRLNFFLIFESVLLGVVGVLFSKPTSAMFFLRVIIILGICVTIIWGYVQAWQLYVLRSITTRLKEVAPEYQLTLERRAQVRWPIPARGLLTYAIPLLVLLVWIVLLIFAVST